MRTRGMRLKASILRSYSQVLANDGKLAAVLAIVPPGTAAVIQSPPLASSWIDFDHIIQLTVAIETLGGMMAVRDFTKKATAAARKPYMGMVEGVLKLFGTSPATLLKRMNDMVKSNIENIDYSYTATGERSGLMEITWGLDCEVPTCVLVGAGPVLNVVIEACGVEGIVGQPTRLAPNKARFAVQW
jgi:hypothetical protein